MPNCDIISHLEADPWGFVGFGLDKSAFKLSALRFDAFTQIGVLLPDCCINNALIKSQ